ADGALAPNGTARVVNPGTSTQQIVKVTAGGGTTSLTVTPALTAAHASGVSVAALWTNAAHPTIYGYDALARHGARATDAAGQPVIKDPGTRPVVLFGNSWLHGMRLTGPARIKEVHPSADVIAASVGGNKSTDLIARFHTDVPTDAAYVIFNEPGV